VQVQRRRALDRWSWTDLRLVPPALGTWATTLLLPWASVPVAAGLALAATIAGVLLGRGGRSARRRVAAAVLAGVAVAAATGAVRAGEQSASPVADLAARGTTAEVALTVDDDPRVLAGGLGPARVLVAGTVTAVDGLPVRAASVLVFGPAAEWSGLLPGTPVTLRATLGPAEPGDHVVAVLGARSAPESTGGPGAAQQVAGELRAGLADSAARVLPADPGGLLPGLVVGDTTAMQPGVTSDFRRAGLGHLTAVSGLIVR
jgi:competence protein ComEC